MQHSDILIIGAGMTGLMAALQLTESDLSVTLVDKGRSVGGRLATRRMAAGRADHGAQFFSVRDDAFHDYVNQWRQDGLVYQWSTGWSDGSVSPQGEPSSGDANGFPRYAVRNGMNALAKHLAVQAEAAAHINLFTNVRIAAVRRDGDHWRAEADDGTHYQAQALVMTAPVPQSLILLANGDVTLPEACHQELAALNYAPCLCALYHVEGAVMLPEPGALQQPGAEISWLADNQRKGISPEATIVTVHAGPDFSRAHYEAPDEEIEPHLRAALRPYLADDAVIVGRQVKRWRYALPQVLYPQRYLQALDSPMLYFGGDAFGGPRVEGAALSGITIGRLLADKAP